MPEKLTAYDGTDVEVEHIKPLANGGARFDIEIDDGRRWQLDVTRSGNVDVVTSWRDGTLADLDLPDWMDDILTQIRMAA